MKNTYKPEGFIPTHEKYKAKRIQRAAFSSFDTDSIYEGIAVKCDSQLNLWVDHCGILCKMPREEVTYLFPGEKDKDIAVISRVGKTVCFKVIGISKNASGEENIFRLRDNYLCKEENGDIVYLSDAQLAALKEQLDSAK